MKNEKYALNVGLEVHAELATQSKAFCGCGNVFGAEPNSVCCPVCAGLPGGLPVLNQKVVEYAVRLGTALGCEIRESSSFDRKQYFYPDLPKAFQITQYYFPICKNGTLRIRTEGASQKIGIERIHIEEDAGKLIHSGETGETQADYNRSGVPLLEIVTRPAMRSAKQARNALEELARILKYLEISDAKMQEGSLRADVNVSVRLVGTSKMGIRTELKNLNSFSAVERAVIHESNRQIELLESGREVAAETRKWDDMAGASSLMRKKDDTVNYRYFPEPDFPPLVLDRADIQHWGKMVPELPLEKTERFQEEYDMDEYTASLLSASRFRGDFFETAVRLFPSGAVPVTNWLLGDIAKYCNETKCELEKTKLTPQNLAEMCRLIQEGILSHTAGKTIVEQMLRCGGDPETIMNEQGLVQNSDEKELAQMAEEVLQQNPKAVQDYQKGKTNVLGFLVGQCMKKSKGKANPAALNNLLKKVLEK